MSRPTTRAGREAQFSRARAVHEEYRFMRFCGLTDDQAVHRVAEGMGLPLDYVRKYRGGTHTPPVVDYDARLRAAAVAVGVIDPLTEVEAAETIGVTRETLNRWRAQYRAPRHRRLLGRPVYARADVLAWIDTHGTVAA